jgi:hypothetical protein
MPLLSRPLELHNLSDTEKLCRKVLHRSSNVRPDDFEDALAYLLATCWELSVAYDPARDARRDFASWAARILDRRVYDWARARYGRTRWSFREHEREPGPTDGVRRRRPRSLVRERPLVVSLDAELADHADHADHAAARPRLVDTLADPSGDPQTDSGPVCGGLLAAGDRERDRDLELLRAAAARITRERARRSLERSRGRDAPPLTAEDLLDLVA